MAQKLFKYKKQGDSLILQTKDSQELVQQLRTEHTNLCKQISDYEMKKQCIEDKLRELQIKFNTFYQHSDYPENPQMVYRQPTDDVDEPFLFDDILFQTNDYLEFIPKKEEIRAKKSLYDYFCYKQDVKNCFNDLNDVNNQQILAEQFGLKNNNKNKLISQLRMIQDYLQGQQFPSSWQQIYQKDFFEKLEI